ncbi:Golgi-associated plant pathogenesis-related protein 1 [Tetranychus urticae]|uniref:SCP domain-containing protein n=1 Tax=Tetranychus urticae TaxID=32264 RepID=T1JZC4_TETUR|nr:Golgi-associated plant pathogenesis-related protein 1 [Tetranychus urticae]
MLVQLLLTTIVFQVLQQPIKGQDCLSTHNYLRALHGTPPLEYDEGLERFALKRAQYMASTDIFEHPKRLRYGENLYWRKGSVPTCQDAVMNWYNEISLYQYSWPRYSPKTGHFTQIVWRDTQKIGCAAAQSPRTERIYIACNYYPPGNVRGFFKQNVAYPSYGQSSK